MVGEEFKEQLLLAWDKEQEEKIERERAVSFVMKIILIRQKLVTKYYPIPD